MELTENEKKKKFLMSYLEEKRNVERLEEQLAELRLNKMYPSLTSDGMPHGTDTNDLSDYVARVDKMERELITKRYCRICAFQDVQRAIEAMENVREKEILTYRYIRGMKWEKICIKMEHSWQHVHRIHAKALKNFKCDGM